MVIETVEGWMDDGWMMDEWIADLDIYVANQSVSYSQCLCRVEYSTVHTV